MAHSPTPRPGSFQRARLSAMQLTAERAELLNSVPTQLLRETVQQALQLTHATGAAIALEHQGELICRAAAGDSAPEVGITINSGSGLTGICASSGAMQLCSNTELDSRVDADACRELGVRAIVVVPLLHQDQLLGLIEVFSRRPYAFGMRDLQALQDQAEKFLEKLQLNAGTAKANSGHEMFGVYAASEPLEKEKSSARFAPLRRFGPYALAVIVSALLGSFWAWKQFDPLPNLAKGQVALISTTLVGTDGLSSAQIMPGTLIRRLNPTYPAAALRLHLQGQVVLQVRIGKDGFVYQARAIRGEHILSEAAEDAVRHWRFNPYRMNGKPLDAPAQITFEFTLEK